MSQSFQGRGSRGGASSGRSSDFSRASFGTFANQPEREKEQQTEVDEDGFQLVRGTKGRQGGNRGDRQGQGPYAAGSSGASGSGSSANAFASGSSAGTPEPTSSKGTPQRTQSWADDDDDEEEIRLKPTLSSTPVAGNPMSSVAPSSKPAWSSKPGSTASTPTSGTPFGARKGGDRPERGERGDRDRRGRGPPPPPQPLNDRFSVLASSSGFAGTAIGSDLAEEQKPRAFGAPRGGAAERGPDRQRDLDQPEGDREPRGRSGDRGFGFGPGSSRDRRPRDPEDRPPRDIAPPPPPENPRAEAFGNAFASLRRPPRPGDRDPDEFPSRQGDRFGDRDRDFGEGRRGDFGEGRRGDFGEGRRGDFSAFQRSSRSNFPELGGSPPTREAQESKFDAASATSAPAPAPQPVKVETKSQPAPPPPKLAVSDEIAKTTISKINTSSPFYKALTGNLNASTTTMQLVKKHLPEYLPIEQKYSDALGPVLANSIIGNKITGLELVRDFPSLLQDISLARQIVATVLKRIEKVKGARYLASMINDNAEAKTALAKLAPDATEDGDNSEVAKSWFIQEGLPSLIPGDALAARIASLFNENKTPDEVLEAVRAELIPGVFLDTAVAAATQSLMESLIRTCPQSSPTDCAKMREIVSSYAPTLITLSSSDPVARSYVLKSAAETWHRMHQPRTRPFFLAFCEALEASKIIDREGAYAWRDNMTPAFKTPAKSDALIATSAWLKSLNERRMQAAAAEGEDDDE